MNFLLYQITDTFFGDDEAGVFSGFDVDEWPVDHLTKKVGADLSGKLILHSNTRFDCSTSASEDGQVKWLDETDPDDDAPRIAVVK